MSQEQKNSFPLYQQAIILAIAPDMTFQFCVQNKVEAYFADQTLTWTSVLLNSQLL